MSGRSNNPKSSIGAVFGGVQPIITVKEARKILGKAYDKCPDEAIERLIKNLDSIAEAYIRSVPKY